MNTLDSIKNAVSVFAKLTPDQETFVFRALDMVNVGTVNTAYVSNDELVVQDTYYVLQYADDTFVPEKDASYSYSYRQRSTGVVDLDRARRYTCAVHAQNSANKHGLIAVPLKVRVVLGD